MGRPGSALTEGETVPFRSSLPSLVKWDTTMRTVCSRLWVCLLKGEAGPFCALPSAHHLLHDGLPRVLALDDAGLHEVAHGVITLASSQDGEAGRGAGVLQPLLDAAKGLGWAGKRGSRTPFPAAGRPCWMPHPYTHMHPKHLSLKGPNSEVGSGVVGGY